MLAAYFDAWRFWRDGAEVWAMTLDELAEALRQAERIALAERKAGEG